jgi:hypothetical protein
MTMHGLFGFITWDWLQGVIRHLLTFFGGMLVASGWITPDMLPELVGAVMTVAGLIFSAVSSRTKVEAVAVEKAVENSTIVDAEKVSTTEAVIVPK